MEDDTAEAEKKTTPPRLHLSASQELILPPATSGAISRRKDQQLWKVRCVAPSLVASLC